MKVHLVDGTFELFRCHKATPPAQDATGRDIGAGRGLIHTLTSLLRQEDVSHVAIAFDTVVDAPMDRGPDGPWSQHVLAADIARALGIVVWPMVRRYEADDALATGAHRFADAPGVDQVVLCTRDKDLAQCVRAERVVLLDRVNDIVSAEVDVVDKWGVPPPLIPSLLALVGDRADGLPGVPGWGRKSAAAALTRYGTIEAIPQSGADWDIDIRGASRLGATLADWRREAVIYRELITLATDVPISDDVDDLRWGGARRDAVEPICERLDTPEILNRIPTWRTSD